MDLGKRSPGPSGPLGYSRAQIDRCVERTLHQGGWGNPDVLLVQIDGARFVVKDFEPRALLVRALFGRWSLGREARAYERLQHLPPVPSMLGWVDRDAIALEYRPGVLLSRSLAGRLPPAFVAELEQCVGAMHELGVVHLDLRHRSNVLAGDDGHPVVLDFASALFFHPGRWWGRLGRRLTSWIDRRALVKWRVRLQPGDSPARSASDAKAALGKSGS